MKTIANVANNPIWQNQSIENLQNEVWKPVKGFEGFYEVSNLGQVKTVERTILRKTALGKFSEYVVKEAIKKPYQNKIGYVTIAIVKENKTITTYLHRIIAEAFVERVSELDNVVNHINGIKNDNRIENLEWVTSSINNIHALDTGLRNTRGSMSLEFVNSVLELRKKGLINSEIANQLKTTEAIVQGITSGKTYKRLQEKDLIKIIKTLE